MKILETLLDENVSNYNAKLNGYFDYIRVDPGEIKEALDYLFRSLLELSWLNSYTDISLRKSYELRSKLTIDYLVKELKKDENVSPIISNAGEYIVSVFSKDALVNVFGASNVPLMELLGEKIVGNPGFDFYVDQKDKEKVVCGEAKYNKDGYGYNSSLSQIIEFIDIKKYILDLATIRPHISDKSSKNLSNDIFDVCASFSSKNMDTKSLLTTICNNSHFVNLHNKGKRIIIIAVYI